MVPFLTVNDFLKREGEGEKWGGARGREREKEMDGDFLRLVTFPPGDGLHL